MSLQKQIQEALSFEREDGERCRRFAIYQALICSQILRAMLPESVSKLLQEPIITPYNKGMDVFWKSKDYELLMHVPENGAVSYYVKELDRKPHTKVCGCSLSILKTSACHKLHPKGWSGALFF